MCDFRPPCTPGAFSFNFDDGYRSWLDAAKVLEAYGFRGTFNVCLRNVVIRRGDRQRMFPDSDILTWDEILSLQAGGHEIASHGALHVDLAHALPAELELEVAGSKRVFAERGVNVTAYACAFNQCPESVSQFVLQYYTAVRGAAGRDNVLPITTRVYHPIPGYAAVDAIADGVWVVSSWHNVSDRFEYTVKQVAENGVRVVSVREMIQ